MHESILYKKLPARNASPARKAALNAAGGHSDAGGANNTVQCQTCNHFCNIASGKQGICNMRENKDGKLYVLNYGKAVAVHIDPIEKKPLYHFMPGSLTYSIATAGCNFKCLHCQNAEISQSTITNYQLPISGQLMSPKEIIQSAIKNHCPSISYTYTEPTIFLEYALDTMKLAHKKNLKNAWVSNGYMSNKTLELILPYLDAINIDLKSFSDNFYRKICGAKLQPILDNLVKIKKSNIHLEVTTLIIPNHNDSEKELTQIAEFIYKKLGKDVPWHVSRFYPTYKMQDVLSTPKEKIYKAVKIGKKIGIEHVYAGNI